ncbi:hypothetical protein EVAR_52895_1 [Eumeta japonica]|uniref:Uncharacterized protein n=1 Tax=Eumeta variegata TaxID=151549 RepID=A0A4C1YX69_EUMVA|nr:hypothetical protein EVAR_52895_1 [Eumeta japonica]
MPAGVVDHFRFCGPLARRRRRTAALIRIRIWELFFGSKTTPLAAEPPPPLIVSLLTVRQLHLCASNHSMNNPFNNKRPAAAFWLLSVR